MHRFRSRWLAILALCSSCAVPVRIVSPFDDAEVTPDGLADALATADVVVLGEQHDSFPVHAQHWRLLRGLYERRPDLIVSMEMFERDVQPVVWQYLLGDIDESEFLARSRPWSNYSGDYRPVIEFARSHHLELLAANAPRSVAARVARQGLDGLEPSPYIARSITAPDDDYFAAFQLQMRDHPGTLGAGQLRHFYEAQCLKDDTMAETIVDRLAAAHRDGRRPLLVHLCGQVHSDHRRGTVDRIQRRDPELRIKVVGVESVPAGSDGTIASVPSVADYVLLVPDDGEDAVRVDEPGVLSQESRAQEPAERVAAPSAGAATPPPAAAAGGRPGLGFRPDYDAAVEGCAIADLVPGGAAEAAGLAAGDVIVAFDGTAIDSVASYAATLGAASIGQRVEVTVHRGTQTLRLPVVVGRSMR